MIKVSVYNDLRLDFVTREKIAHAFSCGEPVTLIVEWISLALATRSVRLVTLMSDVESHALKGQYWRVAKALATLGAIFFRCGSIGGLCVEARAADYRFESSAHGESGLRVVFFK